MAIKVIKRAYRKETARATCSTCGSILEYSKEDIKDSGPMSRDDDYWITCPVCNYIIYVDPDKNFPWITPDTRAYYNDKDD